MLRAPELWRHRGAASALLLPASCAYAWASRAARRRVTPQKIGVPVVCIGNLTLGGAGKTPLALATAEALAAMGRRVFFLSRGYGGRLSGPVQVLPSHTAAEAGDEPLLLGRAYPTIVSRDRAAGAKLAVALGAEAIVMDDGFQNPSLHKDISLLAVDGDYGFGNGRVFPAGPLREQVSEGLARADAAVVIGGDFPVAHPCVLRARLEISLPPEALAGAAVAFAGIGRPEKFRAALEAAGVGLTAFHAFPDHHHYRAQELERMARAGAILLTTEKDHVRLPEGWKERVRAVPARLVFEDAARFAALLEGAFRHA